MTKSEYHKGMTLAPQGQALLSDWNGGVVTVVVNGVVKQPLSTDVDTTTSVNHSYLQGTLGPGKASKKQNFKMHRKLFVFWYQGAQPLPRCNNRNDRIAYTGRGKNIPMGVWENWFDRVPVIHSIGDCLKVWISHPAGLSVEEQLFEAGTIAWKCMNTFARKHGIIILKWTTKDFEEFTVENRKLDFRVLRKYILAYPDFCERKLDMRIDSSHFWAKTRTQPKIPKVEFSKSELSENKNPVKDDLMTYEWLIHEGAGLLKNQQGTTNRLAELVLESITLNKTNAEQLEFIASVLKNGNGKVKP
jgi:hypothetical protein